MGLFKSFHIDISVGCPSLNAHVKFVPYLGPGGWVEVQGFMKRSILENRNQSNVRALFSRDETAHVRIKYMKLNQYFCDSLRPAVVPKYGYP